MVINGSDGLLNGLLECSTNAHDFTHTLHATAEKAADAAEFLEIPARNLDHNVIQTRFETGACYFRDAVLDLVEWNPKTKLGSYEGKRITSSFRS